MAGGGTFVPEEQPSHHGERSDQIRPDPANLRQGSLLQDLIQHGGAKHYLARPDDTVLLQLGDVIPLGDPVNQVVSAGDIVVYAGVVWLIVAAMRGRSVLMAPRSREGEATQA